MKLTDPYNVFKETSFELMYLIQLYFPFFLVFIYGRMLV